MAKRSYQQHCGLAVALDVLAERWTLLIVRDLLPGPRRFGDLFDGLPGISTDLLTTRLQTLQTLGVVERREVRHPAPVKLYALTEEGEELRPIVAGLAGWGERFLPPPGSGTHRVDHRWMLNSAAAAYAGGLEDGSYQLDIDGELLSVVVDGPSATLRYGPAPTSTRVAMQCSQEWLLRAAWTGSPSLDDPSLLVDGDVSIVDQLFTVLRAPGAPTSP